MAMTGVRIGAIRLLCPDPEATARFHVEAFDARLQEAKGDRLLLDLGAQRVELAPAGAPREAPAPANATAFQHYAIVVPDMDAAMTRLAGLSGWSAITTDGPQQLPAASGGATAFKFRDPDGHPLEFLRFPNEAVPEFWREGGGDTPFFGIDHSAITVADTDSAIAFYAGLGFAVAGRQVNRGPEQERLDAVAGAVVEVTTLRPAGGAPPHLELLCYRKPSTLVRPAPDASPLATRLCLTDLAGARGGAADPDGHRLEFT